MIQKTNHFTATLVVIASMVFTVSLVSQTPLRICGMRYNQQTQSRDFVHYNPYIDEITLNTDLPINSFVFGTSTLSAQSGIYYIQSANAIEQGVVRIDADNGTVLGYAPVPNLDFPKEAEFDYQTGELFGIKATQTGTDSLGFFPTFRIEFVRFDATTSQTTIIDTIREFDYIVINTSTYNSITREFIIVGVNSAEPEKPLRIYWIDAETGRINRRSNTLQVRVGELQYDNNYNRLLGIAIEDNNLCSIAEFDTIGVATPIGAYRFSGYIVSNTAYDQQSGLYVGRFLEANSNATHTVVFNTVTGEVESNIPSDNSTTVINEWEINNERFAALKFNTTSVTNKMEEQSVRIAPHPVTSDIVTIQSTESVTSIVIYNANGERVITSAQSTILNVQELPNGVYTVVLTLQNGDTQRLPFVLAR